MEPEVVVPKEKTIVVEPKESESDEEKTKTVTIHTTTHEKEIVYVQAP